MGYEIPSTIFFVGVILFILGVIQWHIHANEGWIGEEWDNEKQEKLYYNFLAPVSILCILTAALWFIIV